MKNIGSVAQRISYFQQKRGLTQSALAEAAGISRQLVWSYVHGRVDPSLKNLRRVCDALGVSLDHFWGVQMPRPEDAA